MALTGVSGAGKTLGALYIAYGFTGDWQKVALLDTEHQRARFYADRGDLGVGEFLWAKLEPPYSPERYIEYAADAAAAIGESGVLIVDSLSHAWKGEGGVLEIKDEIVKASNGRKNDYTAWADAGKLQNKLIDALLSLPCHVICTMRSKMDFEVEENEKGWKRPVKIGLAPIQRDDTEYEFDVVLDITRNHIAMISKDTTILEQLAGPRDCNVGFRLRPSVGEALKSWLDDGIAPAALTCDICGQPIAAADGRTAAQIIAGSNHYLGKTACMGCFRREYANLKAARLDEARQEEAQKAKEV
jgi:hypothetical protein